MAGDSSEHIKIKGCTLFLSQILPLKNRTDQKQQQPWQESPEELAKALPLFVCASLVAQTGKNLPAMQEIWVQALGQEDPLEKGNGTPLQSILLPGKSHGRRNLVGYRPWGLKESDMTERLHFHFHHIIIYSPLH